MDEQELKTALDEVRKVKVIHPEADSIEWIGGRVKVTYMIYPEGDSDKDPF